MSAFFSSSLGAWLPSRPRSLFYDMKEYAERFYKSKAWQACRIAYAKSVGGLCENCLKHGKYNAGVIVHHKVHITPENITNPYITMNFDNLELLCRDCHAEQHSDHVRRYKVDDMGRVEAK